MTSASPTSLATSGVRLAPGGAACSRWSVGKAAASLMFVSTGMSSFSASAMRARQPSRLREQRPASMSGRAAPDSIRAAAASASSAGRTGAGAA
jgi:hypothetical protein